MTIIHPKSPRGYRYYGTAPKDGCHGGRSKSSLPPDDTPNQFTRWFRIVVACVGIALLISVITIVTIETLGL